MSVKKLKYNVAYLFLLLAFLGYQSAYAVVLDPTKDYDEARSEVRIEVTAQAFTRTPVQAKSTAAVLKSEEGWFQSKLKEAKSTFSSMMRNVKRLAAGESSKVEAETPRIAPAKIRGLASAEIENQDQNAIHDRNKEKHHTTGFSETLSFPGLTTSEHGVMRYDLKTVDVIPRLRLSKETRVSLEKFELPQKERQLLESRFLAPLQSPRSYSKEELSYLLRNPRPVVSLGPEIKLKVALGALDAKMKKKLGLLLKPHGVKGDLATEKEVTERSYTPLTDEEYRFLSGLLLYQNGHECAAAVGLFHSLSNKPGWIAESNYFLAMCSKSLGLMTDFSERVQKVFAMSGSGSLEASDGFYASRLLKEIDWSTPNATTRSFGDALETAVSNPLVIKEQTPEVMATVAALIAESAAASEKFKTALFWSKRVPENHPRYLQAKFVEALGEYSIGSKQKALELQEELIKNPKTEKTAREFQGLIALNLARMYFQEQKYKEAHQAFLTINKDHPLWLQGLSELGWAQLMAQDYEGAIGNMYSIQSPFFAEAYKPESYVIRTIGYLSLCQYGDAYRVLTVLEKDYRNMLQSVDQYQKNIQSFTDGRYGTIKRFLISFNKKDKTNLKDVDGLPSPIIREIARQKDFLNLQKALNRQIDEKVIYERIETDVLRSLKDAQTKVTQSRHKIDLLKKSIVASRKNPGAKSNLPQLQASLEAEQLRLNDLFFSVDLFNEAKASMAQYNREAGLSANQRGIHIRKQLESVIANRILKIRTDLSRFMDNNELLRYEVFSASGENIRYQVAGGEKGHRIPANVLPKSKSLQWDFDGEYWEDEIGHYRSSLKNNCPASGPRSQQASLGN